MRLIAYKARAVSVAICMYDFTVSADGCRSVSLKKARYCCARSTSICTLMAMQTSCS
eukprot:SAG31_NODE_47458_length_241_cov_24.345070_1_plen_56_part_01